MGHDCFLHILVASHFWAIRATAMQTGRVVDDWQENLIEVQEGASERAMRTRRWTFNLNDLNGSILEVDTRGHVSRVPPRRDRRPDIFSGPVRLKPHCYSAFQMTGRHIDSLYISSMKSSLPKTTIFQADQMHPWSLVLSIFVDKSFLWTPG